MKQKKVLGEKIELNSINCMAAGIFKGLIVNQGFYNEGEKQSWKLHFGQNISPNELLSYSNWRE